MLGPRVWSEALAQVLLRVFEPLNPELVHPGQSGLLMARIFTPFTFNNAVTDSLANGCHHWLDKGVNML